MDLSVEDIRYLGLGMVQGDPGWQMDSHFHPFHEVIVILKGNYHVRLEQGEVIHATEGDVMFYRAGSSHQERSDPGKPVETIFLALAWEHCPELLPVLSHDVNGRLRQIATWLCQERDSLFVGKQEMLETGIRMFMLELVRKCTRRRSQLLSHIRRYMAQNLGQPISLDDLAAQSGLSKYHFLRRYKHLTGQTPMQDLRNQRLERARELILSTNSPLKDIAAAVGLNDEYHLSKLFRRRYGSPPGGLRKG